MTRWLMGFTLMAVVLSYVVIGVGAFTRLTNAGLGCPDWPACYGNIIVQHQPHIEDFSMQKAQTEMGHRYIAGALGVLMLVIAFLSAMIASDKGRQFLVYAIGLIVLLVYQVLLGMWTVTLQLSPLIVMQHLLAGLAILAVLWALYLSLRKSQFKMISVISVNEKILMFAWICFLLLVLQISLGGWTSSNYAGLIYQGISAIHRWCALVLSVAFIILFICVRVRLTYYLMALLAMQVLLGGMNVLFHIPLVVGISHNLVAAAMVLVMVTIIFQLYYSRKVLHENFRESQFHQSA